MQKIIIFDTTLRDGEQAVGAKMNINEKILIAKNLDLMGVDIIEAGFAASSKAEFEAISQISKICQNSTICSLSRAKKEDIKASFDALANTKNRRIHTFISTSEIHIKYKLNKTHDEVLEMIKSSVAYAKSLTDDIEWSAEDATRTDFEFLCRCIEAAILNGAKTINIPDTVGYFTPNEYGNLFEKLTKNFSNKNIIFSAHCHNDLGMALANSISAVQSGAGQVECTINGIGERAGNCALEELVMAFKTRKDAMPFITNVNTIHIAKMSHLVSNITGFAIQKNKAIVGENAFSHESGIHQDGMLKNRNTYEIMNPFDIGILSSKLVLGKLSGRNALQDRLINLGFSLSKDEIDKTFEKFKALCDKKKHIYDNDIISLISNKEIIDENEILSYSISSIENSKEISLKLRYKGELISISAQSNGILNAGLQCINKALNISPILEKYELKAISMETDAQGIANIVVRNGEDYVHGIGIDTDIIMASIKAYFDACLKLIL